MNGMRHLNLGLNNKLYDIIIKEGTINAKYF